MTKDTCLDDMDPQNLPEPANLKYLRRLVTILTATMILGVLAVIVLLVIRLNAPAPATSPLVLPDSVTLPDGASATAFTVGSDWFGVVTEDDRILIYDRATGALRQTVTLERP